MRKNPKFAVTVHSNTSIRKRRMEAFTVVKKYSEIL